MIMGPFYLREAVRLPVGSWFGGGQRWLCLAAKQFWCVLSCWDYRRQTSVTSDEVERLGLYIDHIPGRPAVQS